MLEKERDTRREGAFCDSTNTCAVKILASTGYFRFGQWGPFKVHFRWCSVCDVFNMHQPGDNCSHFLASASAQQMLSIKDFCRQVQTEAFLSYQVAF